MKKAIVILIIILIATGLWAGLKVQPVMECVSSNGDGTWTAHFGYLNENSNVLNIPIGVHNKFVGTPDEDMGQPTEFQPGRVEFVFSVVFNDGDNFVWTLSGPNGHGSVNANSSSTPCPRGNDSDGDGVEDEYDEYPDDIERAYNNWYPAEGEDSWGSLAYEDYWPFQGDYDFNDMVIDYRFNLVTTGSNLVVDVFGFFRLRAIGADFSNGFGIEFPFNADSISAVTAEPVDLNLVQESSNNRLVLLFFDSAKDYMSPVGEDQFVNTDISETWIDNFEFSFNLTLIPTQNINFMEWLAPFNPFIFINGERGKEVHLPGFPPTAAADPSYFGVGDDDSNLAEGRYYKTAQNLPWAINIPSVWVYPKEKISVTEGYYHLDEWATSSGQEHTDWYIEGGDNTNESKLYYQP